MEDVFKKHFTGNVTSIKYEKGKGDYRTEIESIKKANPDVIVYVGYPADASVILKQTFDENGDVRGNYKVLEVANKTMVPVGSWNPATGIK